MMEALICIDDTDNLESRGTGTIAQLIVEGIEKSGWGICSAITRHQLLLHDDIPYTSHNSSMCFSAELKSPEALQQIIDFASRFLETESAEGSDPGLAVADISALSEKQEITGFGERAKREVLTKKESYSFAEKHGIHLSEHGGDGQGIVGALAGLGLRLGGNDGRVKGWMKLDGVGSIMTLDALKKDPRVDAVEALDGSDIPGDAKIEVGEKTKTVLKDHRMVLLIFRQEDGTWKTCGKKELKDF